MRAALSQPPFRRGLPPSSTRPRWSPTTPTWSSRWGRRRRCRGDTLRTSPRRAPTAVPTPPSRRLRTVRRYPRHLFPPPPRLTTHLLHLCRRARTPGFHSHRISRLLHPRTCLHRRPLPTRLATRRHPCLRGRATRRRRRN